VNVPRPVRAIAPPLAALLIAGCCCNKPIPGNGSSETTGTLAKCDYGQINEAPDRRKYAWIPDGRLSKQCVILRNNAHSLYRAPLDALDFATGCTVAFEVVKHTPGGGPCSPPQENPLEENDLVQLREWNGSATLTIRRGSETRFDIALKPASVPGIDGYPWMSGETDDGRYLFFVYLDQLPKDQGIHKRYWFEVFDTHDPTWNLCKEELPSEKTARQVSCTDPQGGGSGVGQQSDTGGGGEPPLKR